MSPFAKTTILILLAILILLFGGAWARDRPLDQEALQWINQGWASPALDTVANVGYLMGSAWFSLLLAAVIFVRGHKRIGLSLAAITVGTALAVLGIKILADQPRPWQELAGIRLVGTPTYSLGYPSGHAAQVFLTAYLLARYFGLRRRVEAGLYALASLIALTRVYGGEHYPVDAIVGALMGLLIGVLWVRIWSQISEQVRPPERAWGRAEARPSYPASRQQ